MMVSNWGGNVRFSPTMIARPTSIEEIVALVREARDQGKRIRVMGAGHSFSPLVETDQILVDMTNFQSPVSIAADTHTATFQAGCNINKLTAHLWANGLALSNQGDIDHQTIAGAISTGTHGTGLGFGSLSSFITALEFVDGTGQVQRMSVDTHPELLLAAQVQLGTFGILTQVSLKCEPRFVLRDRRQNLPTESCFRQFDELINTHRHCEFFWFPHASTIQVKALDVVKNPEPRSLFDRFIGDELLERYLFAGICEMTRQAPRLSSTMSKFCGRMMPESDYADWSYRVFPSSRKVRFTEMEYAVPMDAGPECFRAIMKLILHSDLKVFFPVEYRVAAADEAWLSPFYRRPSAILSLHVYKQVDQKRYFQEAEAIFRAFDGRPHWGKIHTPPTSAIDQRYPRWWDFCKLRKQFDPDGMFLNAMMKTYFSS